MQSITIQGTDNNSVIKIGSLKDLLPEVLPDKRCVYVTDKNIYRHYTSFFTKKEFLVISPGEKHKTLKTIKNIYDKFLELEIDRNCFVVGVGGGIVSDIVGFVASTFMRGIPFGFISTSLLGQVDAVLGGKNGVNFMGYKNWIGTFNLPDFVINDPAFFKTLPQKEFINGTAEVIKQFIIADKKSYRWLRANTKQLFQKETDFMNELIYRQCKIKAQIVKADEKEKGLRKILNFGHTLGHAIERESGIAHGFAISTGMLSAAKIAVRLQLLNDQIVHDLEELLTEFGLPVTLDLPISKIMNTIKKDKKRNGNIVDFIILYDEGKAGIKQMSFEEIENHLKKI